jgi:hypothetical protein
MSGFDRVRDLAFATRAGQDRDIKVGPTKSFEDGGAYGTAGLVFVRFWVQICLRISTRRVKRLTPARATFLMGDILEVSLNGLVLICCI